MSLLEKLKFKFCRMFLSAEKYAKFLGANIGANCFIATRNWPTESYLITVENGVFITNGVFLHTHGGGSVARSKYPDFDVFGKIIIKDGAYIGSGAHIMPGVTIGKGALVAAGSVVTKSVPDAAVVGGNPAKIICFVDEYIRRNLPYNLNTKKLSFSEKKKFLLSLSEDKFIHK